MMLDFIVITVAVATLMILSPVVLKARRWRGTRIVTCPETRAPAAVQVDVLRAALSDAFVRPVLTLRNCSRWPDRRSCGQTCLTEIGDDPDDCLLRVILARWHEGKSCVLCGRTLGPIRWYTHKPALLAPGGRSLAWPEIAPERVPETLATHRPICWDCHLVETVRREHPNVGIDRRRKSKRRGDAT